MEEGRRRRQLYDEREWAAQSELRRVLAESVSVGEKEGMLRLLLKVGAVISHVSRRKMRTRVYVRGRTTLFDRAEGCLTVT